MLQESRKIHIIEEVLKVSNNATLGALETVIHNSKKTKKKGLNIYDFVGVISDKDARRMKDIISETCETINEKVILH